MASRHSSFEDERRRLSRHSSFEDEKKRRDSWKAESDSRNDSLGRRAHAMKSSLEKKKEEQRQRLRELSEKHAATKTIGSDGGSVGITGHGVNLKIPPGALKGSKDIKVQILGDALPEKSPAKDELSICPSIRCLPSGLTFDERIRLAFNHCAELTEHALSGGGELILYWREKGKGEEEGEDEVDGGKTTSEVKGKQSTDRGIVKEKIVPPNCKFRRDKIYVYVKHLSDFWMRIKLAFSRGKKVGCLTFLPLEMPITRKPILRCYVYDLTEGHKDRIKDEEFQLEFRNPAPESQLHLQPNGKDLHILVKDKKDKEQEHEVSVSYDDVLNLERSVSYIELDCTTKDDNEMKVDINVIQGKGDKEDKKGALILVRTVLAATKRRESYDSEVFLPELEERIEPTEKNRLETERLDDEFLLTVAEEIETDELLESLMIALKITPAARRRCLDTNRLEGRVTVKGTRDMLITWRAQTEVAKQRSRFKNALKTAKLMDLRSRLFPEGD